VPMPTPAGSSSDRVVATDPIATSTERQGDDLTSNPNASALLC
jgi:hypothetical protein